MSKPLDQSTLTSTVDGLLDSYDLDFLKKEYERNAIGMSIPFNECKKHYIQYLLAMIASDSFQVIDNTLKLSPPLHVDVLWHSHILETRRYREFEEIVLDAYRQSGRETKLKHLDHSVVDNKVGREDRIEKTRVFYETLGFEFVSEKKHDETIDLGTSSESSKHELESFHDDSSVANDMAEFYIQDRDGNNRFKFRAPSSARFWEVANMYAKLIGKDVETLRFLLDGQRLSDETLGQLELEPGEIIFMSPAELGC